MFLLNIADNMAKVVVATYVYELIKKSNAELAERFKEDYYQRNVRYYQKFLIALLWALILMYLVWGRVVHCTLSPIQVLVHRTVPPGYTGCFC